MADDRVGTSIDVIGNTVFGQGQYLEARDYPAFFLDGYVTRPDPTLTNNGTVYVVSDIDYGGIVGVENGVSSYYQNSYFRNGAHGTLTVTATGIGESAYGFSSGGPSADIINDGVFKVTAEHGDATGALTYDGGFSFQSRGTFAVSGIDATGIFLVNGGDVTNRGHFTVTSTTGAADGIITLDAGSFDNSGTFTVSSDSDIYPSVGLILSNHGDQHITNSGTMTADYVIATTQWSVDEGDVSVVTLMNSGAINGVIDLGTFTHSGNYPDDVVTNTGSIHGAVFLGTGNDIYDGTSGQQIGAVYGGWGDDTIIGTAAANILYGNEDNDTITGGGGNDSIDGGTGYDIFVVSGPQANYTVTPTGGGFLVTDNVGTDGTDTLANIEAIQFSDTTVALTTTIVGTSAGDVINGTSGNDIIYGLAGDDTINGGAGNDTIYGGDGTDTINGGAGNDYIDGGWNFGTFNGGGGEDTLSFSSQSGPIDYDLRHPLYFMNAISVEDLVGTLYDDNLIGNGVNNHIDGNDGNDNISGLGGADTLLGGNGDDILDGGAGNDTIDGGAGFNIASYLDATGPVHVSLALVGGAQSPGGGAGTDTLLNIQGVTGSNHNDVLTGSDGNDVIDGGSGNDILNAGNGFDFVSFQSASPGPGQTGAHVDLSLQGTPQNTGQGTDTLTGFEGIIGSQFDDMLFGDNNDNTFDGGGGLDQIDGGGGTDTVILTYDMSSYTITVLGTPDASYVQISGNGIIDTLTTVEYLQFADQTVAVSSLPFDTTTTGTSGDDVLTGTAGNDTINGLDGNDTLSAGPGGTNDFLNGGNGDDTFIGEGMSTIDGGDGIDTIVFDGNRADYVMDYYDGGALYVFGPNADDTIYNVEKLQFADMTMDVPATPVQHSYGTMGDDTQVWGPTDDVIFGNEGNDNLDGGAGNDMIDGGLGDDTLNGNDGIDTLSYETAQAAVTVSLAITAPQNTGGSGTDTISNFENLTGSAFDDTLTGDTGDNIINGGPGNDILGGGGGNDTVSYAGAGASASVDLRITTAQNTHGGGTDTLTGFENLVGSDWNDTLTGDANNNSISGGAGNDTINGGGGNDILTGGAGADHLTGGAGADTFCFISISDSVNGSRDTIQDLTNADVIDLSGIDADTTQAGDQAFTLVASFNHHAGQARLSVDAAHDTVLSLDVNGDATADMVILIKGDHHTFTDFLL